MTVVTIHKAKTELSKLLKLVEAGEEVIIARGDKPVAKLVPAAAPAPKSRGRGALKGKFTWSDSFFDPLPEDELAAWEGAYGYTPGHPYAALDADGRPATEAEAVPGLGKSGKPDIR